MSVVEYFILAFALAVPSLVQLRICALKNPVRLTRGLALSALMGVVHSLLFLFGLWVGNVLRFGLPEFDDLVFLGLFVVVALRLFFAAFRKGNRQPQAYDISRFSTSLFLGVATGTNCLFIGLGLGFRFPFEEELWRSSLPLFSVTLLLCYLGVMLGRRKKVIRARRWQLIGVLFLLIFAIKGAFFNQQ